MVGCVKSVCIWSYSGPRFPALGLNTERYGLSLRIQSECGKMWTRMVPNTNTFHAVVGKCLQFVKEPSNKVDKNAVTTISQCKEKVIGHVQQKSP